MTNQTKLKSKEYRNWVRGALGFGYLQEGLFPFTDDVVKVEHARIVSSKNYTPCGSCFINTKGKCKCKGKQNSNCSYCKLYEDIKSQHRFNDPHWVPDCSKWYNDHWQFAKCFMITTTDDSNKTAKDTDASGLLSMVINGKFFQSEFQCKIDGNVDIFSQVRKIRNELIHNATLEVTDQQVTRYLESMIAVLEAMKKLSSDKPAQGAVQKLKELLKNDLIVEISDEVFVHENVLRALKEEVSQVLEPEIKELEQEIKDNGDRLTAVEIKQQDLERKQQELEQIVTNKANLEAKIKDLKKQELQNHLVDQYERHNVNTWISPLMTQENDVNIRDVYVRPSMVVKAKKDDKDRSTTGTGKDREGNEKPIEGYRDLFGAEKKQNRNIFIVGDVGTGKSSFTKMMMQNWCSSIQQRRRNEPAAMVEEAVKDIRDMDRFDFLFYIPLPEIREGTDDIIDMIKDQLPKKYHALVDDIFKKDSVRVLILADGLDEWTPPKPIKGNGLPKCSQASGSTIITTSRPSSRGILNLKSSEYDLKVTLLGLKLDSVHPMVKIYMKLLNKSSDVAAFEDVLSNLPFKDIHNAPMLLQQIIWLYCNNYNIGKSRSVIYIHVINAVLAWGDEKMQNYPKIKCSKLNSQKFQLPKTFDMYPRCRENQDFLILLSNIAYDAYITGNGSSLMFGRYKLRQQLGVSDIDIDTILKTGLLTEVNCADPTYEKRQLSFIHTSYVEYFAALYICSRYQSKITDADSLETPLAILESLIAVTTETPVDKILRLENVLIMICGLVPGLTEHVSECIYKLTPTEYIDTNMYNAVNDQIHFLTSDCISEHNSVDQKTMVKCKLRHISTIFRIGEISSYLDPTSIETCEIKVYELSHEQYSTLLAMLSQAVSMRTLKMNRIKCSSQGCEGHTVDLTNNRELQSIQITKCKTSIAGKTSAVMKSCILSYCRLSHGQLKALSICLSQAKALEKLELYNVNCTSPGCEGHCIEMLGQNQLQDTVISCSMILLTDTIPTRLRTCTIKKCNLSQEQCTTLCTFLSQAESLHEIKLSHIKCTEDACEGHCIDLTNHKQLETLSLSNCNMISITGKNLTGHLQCDISNCNLSHKQCASLCTFLSQTHLLRKIELSHIKCTEADCESHCIDLTNQKQLEKLSLSNCNMISITGTNPNLPSECYIRNCYLSHEQCISLCTFISNKDIYIVLTAIKCTKDECDGHAIDNPNRCILITNCANISKRKSTRS